MTKTKNLIIKKSLIVVAALIVGFLMPYLSRIPLAFNYGAPWIWKYINSSNDFWCWNGFHIFSLVPLFLFGILYVCENTKWSFYAALFGHLAMTFLIYHRFLEHPESDAFLGFFLHPLIIAGASFVCGIVALVAELIITNRKMNSQTKKENENVYV